MRKLSKLLLLFTSSCFSGGCSSIIFGTGALYIHNGDDKGVEVVVEGRTSEQARLAPGEGLLLKEAIAGDYSVRVAGGSSVQATLQEAHTLIVNPDKKACLARGDISRLYRRANEPVFTKEIYKGKASYDVEVEVGVYPGEELPASKPASDFAFFRVAVVPCEITDDLNEVAQFIRKLR